MRISIRRCLSMLRNASDGNDLALPLPMPYKDIVYIVGILHMVAGQYRSVCRGPRPDTVLAFLGAVV